MASQARYARRRCAWRKKITATQFGKKENYCNEKQDIISRSRAKPREKILRTRRKKYNFTRT